MAGATRTKWADCFPRVSNGEVIALCRATFTNVVQLQIVLYLLAQTRGTGRIAAGELEEGAGWEEWQGALGAYGRDSVPIFRRSIAAALVRDEKHVARELRKLIRAGIVVEHEPGCKGKKAVLSVDLDQSHWRLSALRPGSKSLPKGRPRNDQCGSEAAPETEGQLAPENAISGCGSAPLFKKKSETPACSCEQETSESRAAEERDSDDGDSDPLANLTTPALRHWAEKFVLGDGGQARADDRPT